MYWIDPNADNGGGTGTATNFLCDSSADVANLPTSTTEGVDQGDGSRSHDKCVKGSFCISIADGAGYFLDSNDNWVEV